MREKSGKTDILIVGVGGQGTLLASRVLGKYAVGAGYDVKLSEVHGMAQRGGSVMTYVRIGSGIASPIIDAGGADIILAFEKLEALRYLHYLKEGGEVLYSTQEIMPMPVVTGAAEYPQGLEARLPGKGIDALSLALTAGNAKAANAVMLGALCKKLGLERDKFEEALLACIPQKTAEMNKKAFALGFDAV